MTHFGGRAKALVAGMLLAGLLAVGAPAFAAGGHHAVDDAAILEPGQCELEGWSSRANGGDWLVHAGTVCRVGPVELGFSGDYARLNAGSETGWSVPMKWATSVADGLSLGLSVTPFWLARAQPRYQGATVSALATWSVSDTVNLHANIGRDYLHGADDDNRYGIAAEWMVRTGWQLLAERYRERETHFFRAGVRWAGGENWSVDLSRAQNLHGPAASAWTLGATWLLERR